MGTILPKKVMIKILIVSQITQYGYIVEFSLDKHSEYKIMTT